MFAAEVQPGSIVSFNSSMADFDKLTQVNDIIVRKGHLIAQEYPIVIVAPHLS